MKMKGTQMAFNTKRSSENLKKKKKMNILSNSATFEF